MSVLNWRPHVSHRWPELGILLEEGGEIKLASCSHGAGRNRKLARTTAIYYETQIVGELRKPATAIPDKWNECVVLRGGG